MTDIYSKVKRSQIMASISGKNTKPEIMVRKFLFRNGFRFRINVNTMPGKPDIVLRKYKTIIFIHGCFWHGHKNCSKAKLPTTNTEFWTTKILGNIKRDIKLNSELKQQGWQIITVWECKTKNSKIFAKEMNKIITRLKNNIPLK